MIVLDASVLANVVGDDGVDGLVARAAIRTDDGVSIPDLADVETVAVLRKRWLQGDLDDRRFRAAIEDLSALAFDRYPTLPLMTRAYELRANFTAYDAAYVALAEALECELVTADARLAAAPGTTCAVRVIRKSAPSAS